MNKVSSIPSTPIAHDQAMACERLKALNCSGRRAAAQMPADITIDLTRESHELRCFVCDDNVLCEKYYSLASCKTRYTKSQLIEKLGELVGERYMIVVTTSDIICQTCTILINKLDRLEQEACNVRSTVLRFLECKYSLPDGELVNNNNFEKFSHSLGTDQVTSLPSQMPPLVSTQVRRFVANNVPPLISNQMPSPGTNQLPFQVPPLVSNKTIVPSQGPDKRKQNCKKRSATTANISTFDFKQNKSVRMECNKCKFTTSYNVYMHQQVRQQKLQQTKSGSKINYPQIVPHNCNENRIYQSTNGKETIDKKQADKKVSNVSKAVVKMDIVENNVNCQSKKINTMISPITSQPKQIEPVKPENLTMDKNLDLEKTLLSENVAGPIILQVLQAVNGSDNTSMPTTSTDGAKNLMLNIVQDPCGSNQQMILFTDNNGLVKATEVQGWDSLTTNVNLKL